MDKESLILELYDDLTKERIPFWTSLRDDEYGGFYGTVDFDHKVEKRADKGCILNSRILWFFSAARLLFDELAADSDGVVLKNRGAEELKRYSALCLEQARHAYEFLKKAFLDRKYGGVFWAVTFDGQPSDTLKHTYCISFAIYGLAAYFDASGDREAFDTAMEMSDLLEEHCTDDVGYLEAFNRDFTPADNEELSENGVMADKTMNTLLHVFEAQTELLRVIRKRFPAIPGPSSSEKGFSRGNASMAAKMANRMKFVLDIFAGKIYNPGLRRLEVFFDKDYTSIIDLHSYGHDIEASWLIDRGLEVLSDVDYSGEIGEITMNLAEHIYERAYVQHSLLNECENGVDDIKRIWWVQAEAVVGFMHAASRTGRRKDRIKLTMKASGIGAKERMNTEVEAERRTADYFMAAVDILEFINDKLVDRHTDTADGGRGKTPSEWYYQLDGNFEPDRSRNLVDPWKCPYHNGRMYMEMIRRLQKEISREG